MSTSLAQLIWSGLHCDPEDPGITELWEQMPADVHARYEAVAATVRVHLAVGSAVPLTAPRRWSSAADIPQGTLFRPLGSAREIVRADHASQAEILDGQYARGYVEVR
ncbi:hypothetical protein ACPESR_25485 [Nocardia testacea]|uniref:hypothetical protein n=1 Tax=Nocardia testacea TaxID=248551 RepID=UPI003C2BDEA5